MRGETVSNKIASESFRRISVFDIKRFPFPKSALSKDYRELLWLAMRIVEMKRTGQNIEQLEIKIDQLVYELYELSKEEVDLINYTQIVKA